MLFRLQKYENYWKPKNNFKGLFWVLINELFIILEAKTGARRGLRKAKHYEKIDFQPYQSEQTWKVY